MTPHVKPAIRRAAWVLNRLFWGYAANMVVGVASKAAVNILRATVLPKTTSPLATAHLLRVQTVDSAVLAGTSTRAWAKYALPKGLPKGEEKTLAVENLPHEANDFSGVIAQGYGKGTKTLLLSDNVVVKVAGQRPTVQKINYHVHKTTRSGGREHYDIVVTGVKPGTEQWELNIPRGELKGRYAFVKTPHASIVIRMKDNGVLRAKPKYILRKEEVLAELDPSEVIVERKIDGSLGNAHIKDQRVMFRSHRDGGETYYDKLPALEFIDNKSPFFTSRALYSSPSLTGTVLQGELAHPEGSARVAGILNSLAPNSRAIQKERGAVDYWVWDILKYKGRDVSNRPYEERRALAESIVREIRLSNKHWHIVEAMGSSESPTDFYKRVTNDPLPWGEGVVIKPRDQAIQRWPKIKMTGFGYFELVDVIEGEGKYAGSVGRMLVENPANGARGEVGSLSVPDDLRSWIWANRGDLVGKTVKVRSQEVTQRGVPRAGVFYGFHDGDVNLLMQAEALAAGTDKTSKQVMYALKSKAGWRRE